MTDQKPSFLTTSISVEFSIEELQNLKELAAWWSGRPRPQRLDTHEIASLREVATWWENLKASTTTKEIVISPESLIPPDIIGGKG